MYRYFYYLVFINAISNSTILLPRMLMPDRFGGALISIIIAVPFSTVLLYFFMKSLEQFKGLSLP